MTYILFTAHKHKYELTIAESQLPGRCERCGRQSADRTAEGEKATSGENVFNPQEA